MSALNSLFWEDGKTWEEQLKLRPHGDEKRKQTRWNGSRTALVSRYQQLLFNHVPMTEKGELRPAYGHWHIGRNPLKPAASTYHALLIAGFCQHLPGSERTSAIHLIGVAHHSQRGRRIIPVSSSLAPAATTVKPGARDMHSKKGQC